MEIRKKTEGQTLIETAFILILLLLILLGIAEFARAWFTKNSLKNAVRHGARTAVVTQNISDFSGDDCPVTCPITKPTCTGSCTDGNPVIMYAVCCESPGVKRDVMQVSLSITDVGTIGLDPGDTITVTATTTFDSVVSSSFFPWLQNITITTDASMRYE